MIPEKLHAQCATALRGQNKVSGLAPKVKIMQSVRLHVQHAVNSIASVAKQNES